MRMAAAPGPIACLCKKMSPEILETFGLLVLMLMLCVSGCAQTKQPTVLPAVDPTPLTLGRGVNLGNTLEAPQEGEWGVTLRKEYFQLIQDAGLQHVRIPIRWNAHAAADSPYTVEETFFQRIDWAIEQALSRGLIVIINVHHYDELVPRPGEPPPAVPGALGADCRAPIKPIRRALVFELLNEPQGKLSNTEWNGLLKETLAIVRRSNPQRWLAVGGTQLVERVSAQYAQPAGE